MIIIRGWIPKCHNVPHWTILEPKIKEKSETETERFSLLIRTALIPKREWNGKPASEENKIEAHSARRAKTEKRLKKRISYHPAISLNPHSIRYRTTQIHFELAVVVTVKWGFFCAPSKLFPQRRDRNRSFDFPEVNLISRRRKKKGGTSDFRGLIGRANDDEAGKQLTLLYRQVAVAAGESFYWNV